MSPDTRPRMLRVGLTGGIASGKSTVARLLEMLGAIMLDADRIAREVLEPGGPAFGEVVRRFGADVLDRSGAIDREALGSVVFRDAGARRDLESIVHPRVTAEIERRLAVAEAERAAPVAVVDAALLVESGYHERLDLLLVLRCSRETQIGRLLARGLSREDAVRRIDSQAPLAAKLRAAHHVVDTDVPIEETRARVEAVWREILDATAGEEAGGPPLPGVV